MEPIAAVLVGHFIGDWIVQTDYQAMNKTSSWKANQQHMLGYHLTLGGLCVLAMSWEATLAILLLSWVTHSIIDRRWPVKRLMEMTGSKPFSDTMFGMVAVDQALHLSILLLSVGFL